MSTPGEPGVELHFTPTSTSWLNLVERWFRELTDEAIRRSVFLQPPRPDRGDRGVLAVHNGDLQTFAWTASIDSTLETVERV